MHMLSFKSNVRIISKSTCTSSLGPVVQTVASPTADPGVASSIPARSNTFTEIDHEIISMVILWVLIHMGRFRRFLSFNFSGQVFCKAPVKLKNV